VNLLSRDRWRFWCVDEDLQLCDEDGAPDLPLAPPLPPEPAVIDLSCDEDFDLIMSAHPLPPAPPPPPLPMEEDLSLVSIPDFSDLLDSRVAAMTALLRPEEEGEKIEWKDFE